MMKLAGVLAVTGCSVAAVVLLASCAGGRPAGGEDAPRTPAPTVPIPRTLLPSPNNPLVAFRILFHTGSIADPPGKEGLAALTGALLAEGGTRALSYDALLEALYPMAASIGVQVDREVTVVVGEVHRDNLEAYYALLRQVLLEPRFAADAFERLKSDQINAITSGLRSADDENLGKEALAAAMYAAHPYGRPVIGTVQGIRAITLEDVRQFFRDHYTRGNAELGIAGGFPQNFDRKVAEDLARLPQGERQTIPLPAPRKPEGIEATIVTKPTRAWAISIGFPLSITRGDDDYYALAVANSYLGEHRTFNGVLMNKMRGERGLNYGDYSYIESFIQEGGSTFPLANIPRRQQFFSVWIRPVAPQNAHFAIRQAMLELSRLVRDGMKPEEFAATREFLMSYSRLWVQTASRRLGYEMDGKFYGRASVVDELAERLPKLTVDDVNRAIRKHLRADSAYLAVVADEAGAPAFVEALRTNAPSPITYTTETQPEVLEEDKSIAVHPLPVNVGRLAVVPAKEIFER